MKIVFSDDDSKTTWCDLSCEDDGLDLIVGTTLLSFHNKKDAEALAISILRRLGIKYVGN